MKDKDAPDLAGKTFGYWQVQDDFIIVDGQRIWKCRCICGKESQVYESNLLSGRSKSCGCQRKNKSTYSRIEGKNFGRLTALYPTEKRSYKGSVIWHCICNCGNELDIAADELLSGRYVSCGCKRKQRQKQIYKTLHHIDNTCVEFLEKRNHRSDNKSGYQGVYKVKENKYRSTIGFKGKRYHLGYYDTFEEAVAARKEGEEKLHKEFVKYYYEWKRKADEDPTWAKKCPLHVEITFNKTKGIDVTFKNP